MTMTALVILGLLVLVCTVNVRAGLPPLQRQSCLSCSAPEPVRTAVLSQGIYVRGGAGVKIDKKGKVSIHC